MKRLALALILCLICLQSEARMSTMVVGGSVPVAATTYPDIVFWLNFEANDTTGDYDMGASECGADTSGAYASAATISSTGCKVGTYCLSAPSANDYMTFTFDIPLTKGRIGYWVLWDTRQLAHWEFIYYTAGLAEYLLVRASSDNVDEIRVTWASSGTVNSETSATNLADDTWYFIEVVYDTTLGASDYLDLYVNGSRVINVVGAMNSMVSGGTVSFMDQSQGLTTGMKIDNVMISNDPARDFYTDGTTDLSVTTSKPSGSCP